MNAYEKLMAAVEAAIARGRAPAQKQKQKQKRKAAPKPKVSRKKRRLAEGQKRRCAPVEGVESPGPITPALFVPEPAQAESPKLEQPSPALRPSRPYWADAFERAGARAVVTTAPAPSLWLGWSTCKAVDAETGLTCKLLAHPEDPDRHRHERGPFFRVATSGASSRRQMLEEAAQRRFA